MLKINPINVTIPESRWPLPKWTGAFTLCPFIFYRDGQQSPRLEVHERYHWDQQLKSLVIPWLILYLVLRIIYRTGGRNHPMERGAYEVEDLFLEGQNNET